MLPSNVPELRAEEAHRRRAQRRWNVRPLLLVCVVGALLVLAVGVVAAGYASGAQPTLAVVGQAAQMVAQAAETQIARRSRLAGPGDPASEQWKESGLPRLVVVGILAGGLILLVRTRLR